MSAICLGLFQFYFLADGFWQILILSVSIGIFFSSFTALGDNLVLTLSRTQKIDYPRIRLWGSISFIVAAFWGGQLLSGRSADFIPLMLSTAFLLLFLCCLMLPEVRITRTERGRKGLRRLLKSFDFMAFLIMAGLIQGSHAILYSSGTLQWQKQGLDDTVIGLLWAEGVIVEIILFAVARHVFSSFTPLRLLVIGGFAGLLRWIVMGFAPDLSVLIVIQTLHGVTFAATHLGAMRFITEKLPVEISARAQGLYSAVSLGLIMGGGLFASGYLYEALASGAYFFMAGFCVVALLISLHLRLSAEKLLY